MDKGEEKKNRLIEDGNNYTEGNNIIGRQLQLTIIRSRNNYG